MTRALLKDTWREIRHSMGRFISIFTIILLGVSFFAGLRAAGPDMENTADQYFDEQNLMDFRLVSTFGIDENDITAVQNADSVEQVMPGYSLDVLLEADDQGYVARLHSISTQGQEDALNVPRVIQGRLPEKSGECVIEEGALISNGLTLGSEIVFSSGDDTPLSDSLAQDTYRVVGIVESPYYISFERGTSTIGSGQVDTFILIPEQDFKLEYYTDLYVTVKGARALNSFGDEYDQLMADTQDELEEIGDVRAQERYDEIVSEAQQEIDDAQRELEDGQQEFDDKMQEAQQEIDDAQQEIDDGWQEYEDAEDAFQSQMSEAEKQLSDAKKELEDGEKQYEEAQKEFDAQKPALEQQLSDAKLQLDDAKELLDGGYAQLNSLKQAVENGQVPEDQLEQVQQTIQQLEATLPQQQAAYDAGLQEYQNGVDQLTATENTLAETKRSLDQGRQELESREKQLEDARTEGQNQLDDAKEELEQGEQELADAKQELEDARQEGEQELADGRQELEDAKQELADLEMPEWYVLSREYNLGAEEYAQAAQRMVAMAQVFPTLFFVIAAMVCLNTMTRMVDEQRTFIGTAKALGYSNGAIVSKYLIYAAIASIFGSIIGVVLGIQIFPRIIYSAYGIMFHLPPLIVSFYPESAVTAAVLAVLVTTLSSYVACRSGLRSMPAKLMRPKAPKMGKRVFLERIGFLWKRLTFTQKVTARNLFRYKKRFLMTIFGISGSMALMLTGFGLMDSVSNVIEYQFGDILSYEATVSLDMEGEDASQVRTDLMERGGFTDILFGYNQSVTLQGAEDEMDATLVVPEDKSRLDDYVDLRERLSKEEISLSTDSVVLTEKLADRIGVDVGDQVTVEMDEGETYTVTVSGLTENYPYHYIYMSPEMYQELTGEPAVYNIAYAQIDGAGQIDQDQLGESLMGSSYVTGVSFLSEMRSSFEDMISTLSYVVVVLIISAGALAFLILYNLTNINVNERYREIATIKVLGFYDKEVLAYVYRENFILTAIGILVGCFLGVLLHSYIITTVEVEAVMFGRNINFLSYVWSCLLTVAFALIVNFVMFFKLRKIDMVEALKTVE